MKKIYFLFLIFFISLLNADVDYMPTFNSALEKAKNQNKVMLVFVEQDNCGGCNAMKKLMSEVPEITNILNNYYSVVKVNKNYLPDGLSIFVTPTLFFYKPNGKRVKFKIEQSLKPAKYFAYLNAIKTKLLHK
jgi:thioredoxin-related protein